MDLINQLIQFVHIETDTQNNKITEIWSLPLHERVTMGEAMESVSVGKVQPAHPRVRGIYTEENISKFRKGDYIVLHKGKPNDSENVFHAYIYAEQGDYYIIAAGYGQSFDGLEDSGGWIVDRDKTDLRHILINSLVALEADNRKKLIMGMLLGGVSPIIDRTKYQEAEKICASWELNESQRDAFLNSYATNNFYLVQGPPGTGKTWVLAQLAVELAKKGERVLITSLTHRAINNALVKIAKVTGYSKIIKIGQYHNSDDLNSEEVKIKNYEYFQDAPYTESTKGLIVGGSCYAVRTSRLQDVSFDTIIFDEAGQVTIPLAIAGMLSGKKYIFIGDHKQMPPIINGDHKNKEITKSIFETLFKWVEGTMLNVTYRMNEDINAFPSNIFYGGKLIPFHKNAKAQISYPNFVSSVFDVILDPTNTNLFVDLGHTNTSIRSPHEAAAITFFIQQMLKCGISANEIAVIAPYRAQGRLIRNILKDVISEDDLGAIVVDTVERIQGQERDVIFISLTTSNPIHASQRADFYFQPNRLNVAITRPKLKRIVVGSSILFETQSSDKEHQEWINIFKEFYNQCTKTSFRIEFSEEKPDS